MCKKVCKRRLLSRNEDDATFVLQFAIVETIKLTSVAAPAMPCCTGPVLRCIYLRVSA